MTTQPEEVLDLVNERDEVIGSMARSEVYRQQIHSIRVVNAFIKNSEGKLWIPRRQAHKKLYPSALDFSVGGHVSSGETYEEAFAKETREELNLDITKIPYTIVGTMNPHEDNVGAFMSVYEIESDVAPNYNPDDFISYEWLTPLEIIEKLAEGDISKEDLPKILKRFYI